jgi:hypothetical protein
MNPAMKTITAFSALALALSLGACDKGDKKSDEAKKSGEAATDGEKDKAKEPADTRPEDRLTASATATSAGDGTGTAAEATGDSAGTGAAAGTGAGTADPSKATAGVPRQKGELEILSEGSEPKYELRYQAPEGTQQQMEMSLDITADVPMMGKMTMPTMIMIADVVVESVKDGNITSKMTFSDMDVRDTKDSMPGLADEMKKQMGKIKGTGMSMTIAPSGRVLDFQVDQTSDPALQQTVGQTQQSLDQMVAQLPEKPVGKGAKWKIKQTIDQQGMKVNQTITYELVEVGATSAHIKGVAKMDAPKQEIEQQGMKVTLEKLTGSAKTDMKIDFTKVVPDITGDITMKMSMQMMGQAADVSMTTKMKIQPK